MIDTRDGFEDVKKDVDELLKMESKARNIVLGVSATATGTGAIPIPFADMPLLIAQQIGMMTSVSAVFGIKVKKERLQVFFLQILGVSGASFMGKKVATSLTKMIPGIGTVFGGAISAATAGSFTYALGMAFIKICNEVKLGKLSENDMFSKETAKRLRRILREELKNKKKGER